MDSYYREGLPKLGFSSYSHLTLTVDRVSGRYLRQLATSSGFLVEGDAMFSGGPLPSSNLLDNIRAEAFLFEESEANYVKELNTASDPGLHTATGVEVSEPTVFSPLAMGRVNPPEAAPPSGPRSKSFVVAAMCALSFVVVGSALFLYSRKKSSLDSDSLYSNEAPDSILLKNCDTSATSFDHSLILDPSDIEAAPISLVRDAQTMERAVLRANRNRAVLEQANGEVEQSGEAEDVKKQVSFSEVNTTCSPIAQSRLGLCLPEGCIDTSICTPSGCIDTSTAPGGCFNTSTEPNNADSTCVENCATDTNNTFIAALAACSPRAAQGNDNGFEDEPAPGVSVNLPPVPIETTDEVFSPGLVKERVQALSENNPSTPFSLTDVKSQNPVGSPLLGIDAHPQARLKSPREKIPIV